MDEALDALAEALAAVGLERPRAPEGQAPLAELEAALAPMRLPAELRRFWQRVDPATLRAQTYPELHGPGFALESWRMGAELAAHQPRTLVQVAYSSHQCMSVELDVGELAGGALFEWYLVDGGFERRFNGLGDWLAYVARLIEAGMFRRVDSPHGPYLYVPDPDRDSEERKLRPAPAPHPVHGAALHVGRDILEWPAHWQRAAGLRPEDLQPRGATHTIAALLASPPSRRVRATIAARVVDLMGAGGWIRVRVDDGTASLDVACPPATTLLGPRMGDRFEFDVVVEPGDRTVPEDPSAAAGDVAAALLARYGGPPGATAEAIRRL